MSTNEGGRKTATEMANQHFYESWEGWRGFAVEMYLLGQARERDAILVEVEKQMDCRSDDETDFERGRYYAAVDIQSFIYRRKETS